VGSETLRFVVKAKDEASRVLRGVGGSMSALGKMAKVGMAIAAVGVMALMAAIAGLIGFLFKAKAAYESWMGDLVKLKRIPGLTAKGASVLAGTLRLCGVEAGKAQISFGFFAKALDTARQGTSKTVTPFQRLHIALKDSHGRLRTLSELLPVVRTRLSHITDVSRRAGIASKLFGKAYQDMLPWLTKGAKKIQEYAKFTKSLGMEMGAKALKNFSAYRENQKKMSFAWEAIKINAYGALVPMMNLLAGPVVRALAKAAGWMGKFRRISEKKGLKTAAEQMIPGFRKLESVARTVLHFLQKQWPKAMAWIKENGPGIKSALMGIGSALAKVGSWTVKVSAWMKKHKTVVAALKMAYAMMNPPLSMSITLLKHIGRIISAVSSGVRTAARAFGALGGAVKTVGTGALGALRDIISSISSWAQTAYNWVAKLITSASGYHAPGRGSGSGSGGTGKAHFAKGGDFFTTGRRTITVGDNPGGVEHVQITPVSRLGGGRALAMAGAGAPSVIEEHVHVHAPGGTTIIGTARQVAEILAPHAERARMRAQERAGRRR